ncbi:hypothetical protein I4U23_005644 [Adineta vaga]|nr:hypothetical protein I4U23_005644 [Adineta vaga]
MPHEQLQVVDPVRIDTKFILDVSQEQNETIPSEKPQNKSQSPKKLEAEELENMRDSVDQSYTHKHKLTDQLDCPISNISSAENGRKDEDQTMYCVRTS